MGVFPEIGDEKFIETALISVLPAKTIDSANGRALPVALALARRLGIDLASLKGSGRAGTITLDDVTAPFRCHDGAAHKEPGARNRRNSGAAARGAARNGAHDVVSA